MSNVLHDTPPRKLHQTLTMIYPFYYISMDGPSPSTVHIGYRGSCSLAAVRSVDSGHLNFQFLEILQKSLFILDPLSMV